MIRILVTDDHPIIREGVKHILAGESDIIIEEASGGQEALDKVSNNHFDMVILDLGLPDKNGFDVLDELKSKNNSLPILIFSMHPEGMLAVRLLKRGAYGYLEKDNMARELIKAIRKILTGGKYISPILAEKLALDSMTNKEDPNPQSLSPQEFQIMQMIVKGKTYKEICDELVISPKTVSTHHSHILQKMEMTNDVQLVHYCMRNGLY